MQTGGRRDLPSREDDVEDDSPHVSGWDLAWGGDSVRDLSLTGEFSAVAEPAWMAQQTMPVRFVESDRARRYAEQGERPRRRSTLRGPVRPGLVVRSADAGVDAAPLPDLDLPDAAPSVVDDPWAPPASQVSPMDPSGHPPSDPSTPSNWQPSQPPSAHLSWPATREQDLLGDSGLDDLDHAELFHDTGIHPTLHPSEATRADLRPRDPYDYTSDPYDHTSDPYDHTAVEPDTYAPGRPGGAPPSDSYRDDHDLGAVHPGALHPGDGDEDEDEDYVEFEPYRSDTRTPSAEPSAGPAPSAPMTRAEARALREGRSDVVEADENGIDDAAAQASSRTTPQPTARPAQTSGGGLRRASALMASGSLVSRVLGLVRGSLLTLCIGGAAVADTFATANTLPNYIYILLAGGLLNAILIPQITKAMKASDGGQAQIDRLLTLILLAVVPISVAVTVFARPLLRAINGAHGAQFELTVLFAYLTMPQVLFYCLYVLFGQILNARGQFAAFMWAPVVANVVQIVGMGVWLWQYRLVPDAHTDPAAWTSAMVWWLAGTSTLGIAAQALVLVPPLLRGGFRYRPRFDFRGHGLRDAGSMVGWAFGALVVSQAGGLFVQYVMSVLGDRHQGLGSGPYAVYSTVFMYFMIPHSLVTTTIVTALFPRLANAVHERDLKTQRDILTRSLTTPAVAIIPLTAAAIALAEPGIRALAPGWQADAVHTGVLAFAVMAFGMWPFGIRSIQERYTFARGDGPATLRFQLLVSGVALVFTLLMFIAPPQYAAVVGAVGLTVSSVVGASSFLRIADEQMGDLRLHRIRRLWRRLVIVSLPSGFLTWAASQAVLTVMGTSVVACFLALAVGGCVFGGVFIVLSAIFDIEEVGDLLGPVIDRIPGLSRVATRLRRTDGGRRTA